MTIYRGKNGHFASKAEIAAIKAAQGNSPQPTPEETSYTLIKGFNNPAPGKYDCKGFEFKVGKTYEIPPTHKVRACSNGFHASPTLLSAFGFYYPGITKAFGRVKLSGDLDTDYCNRTQIDKEFKRIDKLAGRKIEILEIFHPLHMMNALVCEVENLRQDKTHRDHYKATAQVAINGDKIDLGTRYVIQSYARPGCLYNFMNNNNFSRTDNVFMTSVPGSRTDITYGIVYALADYQSVRMSKGGSILSTGNYSHIQQDSGDGSIDVQGKATKVVAAAGNRVRFRHIGCQVTFIDFQTGVAKQLVSGTKEAPLNKWLRFSREQKIIHEHKLSITDC